MEEIEICLKSNVSFEELKDIMVNKGFKVQEDFQMNDIYMVRNEVDININNKEFILKDNVLVRETVGKRVLLVKKIKEFDINGNVIKQKSSKCKIETYEDGYKFMKSIGYKKAFELKDHNILLTNGINEIYIQDVENLGVFVEMENKNLLLDNDNGSTLEELLDNIKKYDLPLDYTNISVKKAEEMLIKISKKEL